MTTATPPATGTPCQSVTFYTRSIGDAPHKFAPEAWDARALDRLARVIVAQARAQQAAASSSTDAAAPARRAA